MKTKLLTCEIFKSEIELLMKKLQLDMDIIWVESGLHSVPKKLHARLQQELDLVADCDRLLFGFGHCGDAVVGLKTGSYETVIPKVDDCISLFFGSDDSRTAYSKEHACIFMSDGWLKSVNSITHVYDGLCEQYDEDTADEIMEMMYGHYREIAVVDTGVCPVETLYERAEISEEITGLKRVCVSGSLDYLERLLTGPWNEEKFCILPADTTIPKV